MILRADREDYSDQEDRVAVARRDLAEALAALHFAAKAAHRAASSSRGVPDLDDVYAAVSVVRRREEALDIANIDLATAIGADL